MKFVVCTSLLSILIACNSNPLGDTKISSCDHSPNFKTGLPATCQVNFKNTEGLKVWLDSSDAGTILSSNQTDVDRWSDKSGGSVNFISLTDKASLVKKQVNGRTVIKWSTDSTAYTSSALTEFNANADFVLAVAFKTAPSGSDKLKIDNGTGNGFEALVTTQGFLQIALSSDEPLKSSTLLPDERVSKLVLVYDGSEKELYIYNDSELLEVLEIEESSSPWTELNLSGSIGLELYEVLIYNSFKSSFKVSEIQTYLNNKWGF